METALLALCKRLIAIPSVTTDGTRRIVDFCANEVLAPAGISARILPSENHGPGQLSLLARIKGRDSNRAPLVLNTHLDTVPPGNPALWTRCGGDPFNPVIDGDRIHGLGAADTKLDFAAKSTALIESSQPRRDVWLVTTFGEEQGLLGAHQIAASGVLPRGALAMVGEASHLQVITAHKGLVAFNLAVRFTAKVPTWPVRTRTLSFTGKAAHSSTPALGENAIVKALVALTAQPAIRVCSISGGDAVNKVAARCEAAIIEPAAVADQDAHRGRPLHGDKSEDQSAAIIPTDAIAALALIIHELQQFADSGGPAEAGYAFPTLTCNPGVLRTHPNALVLEFEFRPPPSLSLDAVRDGVAVIVDRIASQSGVAMELSERRANPGFRSAEASETVALALEALARAGLPLDFGVKAGCTEAGVYAAAGLHPVVFGPGPSTGVIHAPNEYNLLSEVEGAIRFYSALLDL